MDKDTMMVVCRLCNRKVQMHHLVPSADGDYMVCQSCAKKQPVKKQVPVAKKPVSLASSKQITEKLVRYHCPNCDYRFVRKSSQQVTKCPYCDKAGVELDDLDADSLLS
ncbi:MAG: hypothetical protein QW594_01700 [Candidatus Woesearchaeota archaeon]